MGIVFCSCEPDPPAQAPPLQKGVSYLLGAQADDGGWHSKTYGPLKGGAATTSLALYALAHLAPVERARCESAIRRGVAFLSPGIRAKGHAANSDGSPDYPTYAAAMLLWADDRGAGLPRQVRDALERYLLASQLAEGQGWTPSDAPYGGWDHLGALPGTRRVTTGADLSVTCFALEGLRRAAGRAVAVEKAIPFVERCRNPGEGGFLFTPDRDNLGNKAGPRSYGTMTADGIRACLACDLPADCEVVRGAVAWLRRQRPGPEVPGFPDSLEARSWSLGLRFYYAASLSKILPLVPEADRALWRDRILRSLAKSQRPDGSWANPVARMREDDPLIATCFAVIALAELDRIKPD